MKKVKDELVTIKEDNKLRSAPMACLVYAYNDNQCNCPDWVAEEMGCTKHEKEEKKMRDLPEEVKKALKAGKLDDCLTERKKKILKLRYLEGLKVKDVAQRVGLAYGYTSTLKNQAIDEAQEYIEENKINLEAESDLKEVDTPELNKKILLWINGDVVRIGSGSDTEKLIEVLHDAGLEAEAYERVR